jgi:hypothetical protein
MLIRENYGQASELIDQRIAFRSSAVRRRSATETVGWRGRMTGSTARQDISGLKHALQLGVGSAIIVLTIVLSWQQ